MSEGLPRIRFSEAIKKGFSGYRDYNGRSRRSELWFFFLFQIIILLCVVIIFGILAAIITSLSGKTIYFGIVTILLLLPFNIPLGVRRLHDIGKNGYFLLIALIPIIDLYIIYLFSIDSVMITNEYGPSPKYSTTDPSSLNIAE